MSAHRRSTVRTALLAGVLSLALAAAAWGTLAVLPTLSPEEKLAVRAVRVMADRDSARTLVRTRRGARRAACRKLPERRELVLPGNGRPFLLVRSRPASLRGEPLPRSLLEDAYLAGCPRLLAQGVGRRLLRSRVAYAGFGSFAGRRAHELIAASGVRLFVEVHSLEPVGVRLGRDTVALFRR